ncbi:LysR family transcriptional regulator [Hamadaea tsunoensis]|uniref:LysR family transcriptional regulator n=1 Tax=Hamadaea tsunoensis TaxID=53368 RepID=UPI00041E6350|nr:LysR family transcriptional regulator [Hamadaea tsunoensis]
MVTLHQLRCFLATVEHGSFTAAAADLGYAQPSISEQVRLLEQALGAPLFRRAGRGLVPTEEALTLQPYAAAALATVDEGARAVSSVRDVLTGTVRFGIFSTSRFYLGADLVADVLGRHPGVRVEFAGRNSAEVLEHLRKGRLEAAVIALPVDDAEMAVTKVMRDELVYVSADPERVARRVTAADLASAQLVLSELSWRDVDSTRHMLVRLLQAAGHTLRTRVEVEDTETALDIAARGLADTVTWRGVLHKLGDRAPAGLHWTSLRPRLYEEFALVHRPDAQLSAATRAVVEIALERTRALDAVLRELIRTSR